MSEGVTHSRGRYYDVFGACECFTNVYVCVHVKVDGLNEDKLARHKKGNLSLGTTKKGIGPAYGSKIMRNGETAVIVCVAIVASSPDCVTSLCMYVCVWLCRCEVGRFARFRILRR